MAARGGHDHRSDQRRDQPSLTVQPAAGRCLEAVRNGARLVIMNAEVTPYDEPADAVLRGPIGESLPRPVELALGSPR